MISRKFIVSLAALSFSISVFAQGGFSYPGNFEFKPFTESTKAYNYSGVDVLLARNTSSNVDRHFTFLKNSFSNWGFLKLSNRTKLYTQIQRTDELFVKDPGLTAGLLNSMNNGFQWDPDTSISLNGARFGIVGFQDYGSWVEIQRQKKDYLVGFRLRDYTNIYAMRVDTGSISNRYTSNLNTGSEYVAYAQIEQVFLQDNNRNLGMLILDAKSLVLDILIPKNFQILFDYTETNRINDQHQIEYSLIGIPLYSHLNDLLTRRASFDWRFSGINLDRLDSIIPSAEIQRDSAIGMVNNQLNSSKNIFKTSQEIHFGWTYIPHKAIRLTAKYSYYSNHLFQNANLSFGAFQNHGKNLQIMTRMNFSSQFGNWNELGLRYKPFPGATLFMNATGTDIIRFRETLQVKKNFKILHLSLGLFANL